MRGLEDCRLRTNGNIIITDDSDGFVVAKLMNEATQFDLQRLVASWNACAGIPTEDLEQQVHGLQAAVLAYRERLAEAERLLKPLAAFNKVIPDAEAIIHRDDAPLWGFDGVTLTYGDIRRAAAFLGQP